MGFQEAPEKEHRELDGVSTPVSVDIDLEVAYDDVADADDDEHCDNTRGTGTDDFRRVFQDTMDTTMCNSRNVPRADERLNLPALQKQTYG